MITKMKYCLVTLFLLGLTLNSEAIPPTINNIPTQPFTLDVTEGSTGGVFVVDATDVDGNFEKFIFVWNPSSAYFTFNDVTGEVSVVPGAVLSYQVLQGQVFRLGLIAQDTNIEYSLTKYIDIRVTQGTGNTAPTFFQPSYTASVTDSTIGTPVFLPLVSYVYDPDVGDTLTFSLQQSTSSQYFVIHPFTGQISFLQNYDTAILPNQVTLVVRVIDSAGAASIADILVSISNGLPVIPNLPANAFIDENSMESTNVFLVNPPLVNQVPVQVTFSMTQTPTFPSVFTINTITGQVKVAPNADLNYEARQSYILNVIATGTTGTPSAAGVLTINVNDLNESPVFSQNIYTITVQEGPIGQTVIGSLLSSVLDPDNDLLAFLITDSSAAPGSFDLNTDTGEVTYMVDNTIGQLSSPVTLTIMAYDPEFKFDSAIFTINILGTNQPPTITNLSTGITISENQALGVGFFTATGTDPDQGDTLTYRLPVTLQEIYFHIDPNTGVLSLKTVSTGYLQSVTNPSIDVDIMLSDGTASTTETLTINIDRVDDNTPPLIFVQPNSVDVLSTQSASTSLAQAFAFDQDQDVLTFSLPNTYPENLFSINPSNGEIFLASANSLLSVPVSTTSLDVDVLVNDGTDTATAVLTINIQRINNNPPVFTIAFDFITLNTNQNPLTSFYTAQATDLDGDTLTYSLPNTYPETLFVIDPNSGELYLQSSDSLTGLPTSTTSLQVSIIASDGRQASTSGTVYMSLERTPNIPPVFTNLPGTPQTVASSTLPSQPVFTAVATDSDNNPLTYSLSTPYSYPSFMFQIDSSSGVLSLSPSYSLATLEGQSLQIPIGVSDGTMTVTKTLTLVVGQSNVAPVFSLTFITKTIPEGLSGKVVMSDLSTFASDVDGDQLLYSFVPSVASFQIDSFTGVITYIGDYLLAAGKPNTATLAVRVTDPFGATADTTLLFSIQPIIINNSPPMFSTTQMYAVVSRYTQPGEVIYTVEAYDADVGSNIQYSIQSDPQNMFTINPTTGEVTLQIGRSFDAALMGNTRFTVTIRVTDGFDNVDQNLDIIAY